MPDIELLRNMLFSGDIDEAYDALIDIGKGEVRILKDEVRKFLDHKEPDLQRAAIMVFGTFWQLPEFKDELVGIFLNSPDNDVRFAALVNWTGYFWRTKNREVLRRLDDIVTDSNEDGFVRVAALRGMFMISGEEIDTKLLNQLERII